MTDKRFETLDRLCSILVDERGLACDDRSELKDVLARTGYCRFSGYARQFQVDPRYGDNRFVEGTSLGDIASVMEADGRMRALLLQQLSVVELAVRASLAHEYGRTYGAGAFYLDTGFYREGRLPAEDRPLAIVKGILGDLERDKGPIVARYVDKGAVGGTFEERLRRYGKVPSWVAAEAVSFGRVTNFVSYVKDIEPAKRATSSFGIQWEPFAEVLHSLCVLRNACAHHRQLWHRRIGIQCPVQRKLRPRNVRFDPAGPYADLIMLNSYREKIDGDDSVALKIESLLGESVVYSEGFRLPSPK